MTAADRRDWGTPPHTTNRKSGRDILGVFMATALWASSGIFLSLIMAQGEVSIFALAFYRDLGSFLVLLLFLGLFRPHWLRVQRQDLKWFLAVGACIGGFHVLWNLSVALNGVAVATVQQAVSPILVSLLAWVVWGEQLTWWKIAAVLLSLVGTVFVSGLGTLGATRSAFSGLAVGLMAALMYAGFNLFGKKTTGNHSPLTVLVFGLGFASLLLAPIQFTIQPRWTMSPMSVLYLVCTIFLPTILGFATYLWALQGLEASVASILAMSEIPIAYLYSYVFLGERLSVTQIAGALLVVGGVMLMVRPARVAMREE